jgi:hypothetical protein
MLPVKYDAVVGITTASALFAAALAVAALVAALLALARAFAADTLMADPILFILLKRALASLAAVLNLGKASVTRALLRSAMFSK